MGCSDAIALITGGFDPVHSGHIKLIQGARSWAKKVVVGLNSDEWLIRKKGGPFMTFEERKVIMENIKGVDHVIHFDDSDGSACDAITRLLIGTTSNILFINGGDRNNDNIPEYQAFKHHPRVMFVSGVGGRNKTQSSSTLLQNWVRRKVDGL